MIRAPKGVEDLLPPKTFYYSFIEKEADNFFSLYGYREIRIPTFERTELFLHSVGEETDVGKQMYTFRDRRGRSISLRPEGTAGIVRAYLEHRLYGKKKEWRLYYKGPMFRYERPQAGRLREFYQIGVECFGEENPWLDVEIVEMAYHFLRKVGLENLKIQINSIGCRNCRAQYLQVLKDYLKEHLSSLCQVCQRRYNSNTLRVLDCKITACRGVIEKAPQIKDFLCLPCLEHFNQVIRKLDELKVEYVINPHLVRGLDYYTRTIFEVISPYLGSQDTVCAGGRYDELVAKLGGPPTPALGFAIGVERLVVSLSKAGVKLSSPSSPGVFIATLGDRCIEEGMRLAGIIRSQGTEVRVNFQEKSLSSQLKRAHKEGFSWVLIIGKDELEKKRFLLKNMKSGEQREIDSEDLEKLSKNLRGAHLS